MSSLRCYKCNTADNLSIKARHRDGSIRIKICRDCRKGAYKKYSETKEPTPICNIQEQLEWEDRALENYIRISRKWA